MLKAFAIPFQPSWNVSKRVETMLNRCWKSLKAFQLCFNTHSRFLLYSGMFGMLKRSWSRLPLSFNIVERVHAQLRRRSHGHSVDAKTIAKQYSFHFVLAVERPGNGFSINLSHYGGLWDARRFCRRDRSFNKEKKSTGGGQKKKNKAKWKSDEIETLIDELEKRSCLWDIFDKEYHNREKRDIAYTELGRHS